MAEILYKSRAKNIITMEKVGKMVQESIKISLKRVLRLMNHWDPVNKEFCRISFDAFYKLVLRSNGDLLGEYLKPIDSKAKRHEPMVFSPRTQGLSRLFSIQGEASSREVSLSPRSPRKQRSAKDIKKSKPAAENEFKDSKDFRESRILSL